MQANGALRDMVCRGLDAHAAPPGPDRAAAVRRVTRNPMVERSRPVLVSVDEAPLQTSLAELGPLEVRQVRRTPEEALFNSLLQHHHYLGYTQPVGEHLKYLVYAQGRPIACVAWSSAPRHLGSRDRFIGWDKQARLKNIGLLAYNTRFLILPWVTRCRIWPRTFWAAWRERCRPTGSACTRTRSTSGDLHRSAALSRHLLPGGQLEGPGGDDGTRQG